MLYFAKTLFYIDAVLLLSLIAFRFGLRGPFKDIVRFRTVAIVLLVPVVGLFGRSIYVLYAYLFVAAAFTSRSKSDLCAVYVLMVSLCPLLSVQLAAGSTYLMSFSTLHAINLGALFGFFITRGKVRRGRPSLDLAVCGLFVFRTLSMLPDLSPNSILRLLVSDAILIAIPYYIVSRSIADREDLTKVLLHFMLGATLSAGIAIFEALKSWPLYQSFNTALHLPERLSKTLAVRGGRLRVPGSFLDYTALGMFLAVALSVVPYLRRNFTALGWYGLAGGLVMGLAATQSRGAWVGAAAGIAILMIWRGRIALVLAAGAALAAGRFLLFNGGDKAAAQTAQYRLDLLEDGLRQFISHPLFGQFRSSLQANMKDMIQGQHIIDFVNTHLHIALISGSAGLAVWLMMWGAPAAMCWRAARREGRSAPYPVALVPVAILVTSFVTLTFTSMVDRNLIWPAIAMALVVPCIAATRQGMAGRARPRVAEAGTAWPAMPDGRKLPRPAILLPR